MIAAFIASTVVGSVCELSTSSSMREGLGSKLRFFIFCSKPFSYRCRLSMRICSSELLSRVATTLRTVPSELSPLALRLDWAPATDADSSVQIVRKRHKRAFFILCSVSERCQLQRLYSYLRF